MHVPKISGVSKRYDSRYSLVIVVAKRAREIAQEAKDHGELLIEKPVTLAVTEFEDGGYIIVNPNGNEE